ncbi:MAG: Ni/Fe hydrogenase subunit alpha [Nanoarchaeota archaeon]|nr:Ni/Fe hydrogenase subunit alpha [Nanoarchaeota archaeon]MBU1322310.1 Ni/Fe hydrogenase subunit alpha [Nanoarchaeota archaeon]MBU1597849.1 Ni/Fe hydrogenase subunit alpha [Nanoarchaeota archaeon]MBU2441436.1 Ni/Fe hydrogenase subunit alpha [Nanoarchaeota archaeon]
MSNIELNHICKVEGHGSLHVEIKGSKLVKCKLGVVEGARFFEGLVAGKRYDDIQEITSRICGICSCAHTVACLQAIENAMGVKISEQTRRLRELLSVAERIRSHATHLYFLALPDYLGYESALAMTKKYKKEILRALNLMKLGNNMVQMIGGKEMHPFTSVVGGFTHVPDKETVSYLRDELKKALVPAVETANLFLKLKQPKFESDKDFVALKPEKEAPLISGNIISLSGLDINPVAYDKYLDEEVKPYSTAKFSKFNGKLFNVGALARINTSYTKLSKKSRELFEKAKLKVPIMNPYYNNVAQAIELVHWVERGYALLNYDFKFEGLPEVNVKAGRGVSAVEAPRGILYHDYTINNKGFVEKCNIITPTAQNLRAMEDDVRLLIEQMLKKKSKKDKIILEVEKLIRSYDPCFSCSAHFLKVKWIKR